MCQLKDKTSKRIQIDGEICSWIERINIVKMAILPKNNLQIQCNPYLITKGIFHRIRTKI